MKNLKMNIRDEKRKQRKSLLKNKRAISMIVIIVAVRMINIIIEIFSGLIKSIKMMQTLISEQTKQTTIKTTSVTLTIKLSSTTLLVSEVM